MQAYCRHFDEVLPAQQDESYIYPNMHPTLQPLLVAELLHMPIRNANSDSSGSSSSDVQICKAAPDPSS